MSKAEHERWQPLPVQWWQADAGGGGEGAGEGAGEGEEGAAGGGGSEPGPFWREDWRQHIAESYEEGDARTKELKLLERYTDPAAIWKKARAAEAKIASGEYRMTLPDDASDEQIAEFRKANGIPEAPDGYDLNFDDGLVIGEEDKGTIDGFLEFAHKSHLPNDQVKATIQWYYGEQERITEERQTLDHTLAEQAEDRLREEWGTAYRPTMNAIQNFMAATMPKELRDSLLAGRLADLTPVGSSPAFLQWMDGIRRQLDEAGTLTGPGGEDAAKGIDDRINEIQNIMRTDRPRYNRENLAEELRDLHRKKERMKGQAA